jgi:hypothetical protein
MPTPMHPRERVHREAQIGARSSQASPRAQPCERMTHNENLCTERTLCGSSKQPTALMCTFTSTRAPQCRRVPCWRARVKCSRTHNTTRVRLQQRSDTSTPAIHTLTAAMTVPTPCWGSCPKAGYRASTGACRACTPGTSAQRSFRTQVRDPGQRSCKHTNIYITEHVRA